MGGGRALSPPAPRTPLALVNRNNRWDRNEHRCSKMTDGPFQHAGFPDSLSDLESLSEPFLDPFFWHAERGDVPSSWWAHVPFGHWIVCALRPRLLVELGTQTGVSYSAFCQAVARSSLNTRCYAVDTWRADPDVGEQDTQVFDEFRRFHDERYGAFSALLRADFDEARDHFADGSVDLLHIAGLATYERAWHNFESWLPKLSERAVVLLHNTNERSHSGAWRVWSELCRSYPHFEFLHGYGLGILAVGAYVPANVADLCRVTDLSLIARIRERFSDLGDRWKREKALAGELARLRVASAHEAERVRREVNLWESRCREMEHAREQIARRLDTA